jgi:hypothetical protein
MNSTMDVLKLEGAPVPYDVFEMLHFAGLTMIKHNIAARKLKFLGLSADVNSPLVKNKRGDGTFIVALRAIIVSPTNQRSEVICALYYKGDIDEDIKTMCPSYPELEVPKDRRFN